MSDLKKPYKNPHGSLAWFEEVEDRELEKNADAWKALAESAAKEKATQEQAAKAKTSDKK